MFLFWSGSQLIQWRKPRQLRKARLQHAIAAVKDHLNEENLEDIKVQILILMATAPSDQRASGFAMDLGVSEYRATYHLERLSDQGFVRKRGFILGGGYALTQKGQRYLMQNDLL
jgi:predicted transcriptional regulator